MTSKLHSAAAHIDAAINDLVAAKVPAIACMVIDPIISVLGPLAQRIRQVAGLLESPN